MKPLSFLYKVVFTLFMTVGLYAGDSCVSCHGKIEDIRHSDSQMMKQIAALGKEYGDRKGCTVCHGGNPDTVDKAMAHKGAPKAHAGGLSEFVRDPGSIWIADKTCGICHKDHVRNSHMSLMQTEAGKIQGNLYSWGTQKDTKVVWGNYNTKDDDGQIPVWGTDAYKAYMTDMIKAHPNQFPTELKQLPLPPMSAEELAVNDIDKLGQQASITFQRTDCQRCHLGVRGRKGRGDWRGMGCSACHIPYSNEGYYEGKDESISKTNVGKLLVHTIQSTRDAKVKVNDKEFSGIHPETCNSCHNRGKRIGVSYVGLMETDYNTPIREGAQPQIQSHGKRYMHIKDDLHFAAGMTCQDCHTSIDMHGDGNIPGTTLAQVEIECQDCHGTTKKLPWELPLGYGEEFGKNLSKAKPRGLAQELPYWMTEGENNPKQGGYLLSARGNPLGNVVKDTKSNKVTAHLASGKDLVVPLLKEINDKNTWKSPEGKLAMTMDNHMENMECYSCHADWAPQCYGCHLFVDYSKPNAVDWIATGMTGLNSKNGETIESVLKPDGMSKDGVKKLYGQATENRSYLRWEDPMLGINGEGRVSPIMPGCQVTFTVIGPKGETFILNKQARVKDTGNVEVAGTDMSPVQPHTTGRKARSCESCHNNPKTLGYGIGNGEFLNRQHEDVKIDLQDLRTGEFVSNKTQVQMKATPGMNYDWSKIVTRDGKQLQVVGTHWETDGPLPKEMRDKMEKTGLCVGCHQNMNQAELWNKLNTDKKVNAKEHVQKMSEIFKKAAGVKK